MTATEPAVAMDAPAVPSDRALAAANADAVVAYKNLNQFRIEVRLADDGWHVDYYLAARGFAGGGPHYLISAQSGEILSKRYDQ